MSDTKALVLGATGGIGGETAAALLRHGWTVVAMARDPARRPQAKADALADATWMSGDAMNADDVLRAAEGVQAIIHAVNPPGYRNWGNLVLPMIDHSVAAAKATGARVVLPGTIYNYGYDAFPELVEDSPQHPVTEKGRIRVELERRLEAGSREGAPALIVRFADFFRRLAITGSAGGWLRRANAWARSPIRAGEASATPGPICRTPARRSRGCWTAPMRWSRSPASTSPACGTPTGRQ